MSVDKPKLVRIKRRLDDASAETIIVETSNPRKKGKLDQESLIQQLSNAPFFNNGNEIPNVASNTNNRQRYLRIATLKKKDLTKSGCERILTAYNELCKLEGNEPRTLTTSHHLRSPIKTPILSQTCEEQEKYVAQSLRQAALQKSKTARYEQILKLRTARSTSMDPLEAKEIKTEDLDHEAQEEKIETPNDSKDVWPQLFKLYDLVMGSANSKSPMSFMNNPGYSRETEITLNYVPLVRTYLEEHAAIYTAAGFRNGVGNDLPPPPKLKPPSSRARPALLPPALPAPEPKTEEQASESQPPPAISTSQARNDMSVEESSSTATRVEEEDGDEKDFVYDVYVPMSVESEHPEGSHDDDLHPLIQVVDDDSGNELMLSDRENSDHDSEDSNAESYYANSYPDDEDAETSSEDDAFRQRRHTNTADPLNGEETSSGEEREDDDLDSCERLRGRARSRRKGYDMDEPEYDGTSDDERADGDDAANRDWRTMFR